MSDSKTNEKDDDGGMEQLLLVVPKCFVFQIPKLATSAGHKASDWPKDAIWSGRLRVVSQGGKCTIKLEHLDKEGLFAQCPVTKQTVEPVSDSSRYFVLRISDGRGRHATIGLGFKERTEAFDFKVALQDYENQTSGEAKAEESASVPLGDLSIPQGAKIHVNIPGGTKKKKPAETKGGGGGLFALAPPPTTEEKEAAKKKKKKSSDRDRSDTLESTPNNTPSSAPTLANLNADDFGFGDLSFTSGNTQQQQRSQPQQQQRPQQQQQPQSNPDWISFD